MISEFLLVIITQNIILQRNGKSFLAGLPKSYLAAITETTQCIFGENQSTNELSSTIIALQHVVSICKWEVRVNSLNEANCLTL